MKNLALILGLIFTLHFDANAMNYEKSQSKNDQSLIRVTKYRVGVHPAIEVSQIPSEKKISFGGYVNDEINMNTENYNGINLHAPIHLQYDMSHVEITDSLSKSFHTSIIDRHYVLMNHEKSQPKNNQSLIRVTKYRVGVHPAIEVWQIPSEKKSVLEDMSMMKLILM